MSRFGLRGAICGLGLLAVGGACAPGPSPAGSPSPSPERVRLSLNSMVSGRHAGFVYAHQLGYDAQDGFELAIDERRGSAEALSRVVSGESDFGVVDGLAAMRARSQGSPVRVVSTLQQSVSLAIVSLRSADTPGIRRPSDLVGKRIGAVPNSTGRVLLGALLDANHVDPTAVAVIDVPPTALVDVLLAGQVDAIVGAADVEALQVRARQEPPAVMVFRDAGVDLPGLVLVASDALIQRRPDLVNRFVRASVRGWAAARAQPAAAARSVVDQFLAGYENEVRDQLVADEPLWCRPGSATLGVLPDAAWSTSVGVLTTYGLLPPEPPASDYYVRASATGGDLPAC